MKLKHALVGRSDAAVVAMGSFRSFDASCTKLPFAEFQMFVLIDARFSSS